MRVVGYATKWSVQGGDRVEFKVSCDASRYAASIVRLIHGDTSPRGPGLKFAPIATDVDGTYPGRRQELRFGSYVRMLGDDSPLRSVSSFTCSAWIYPTDIAGTRTIMGAWSADRSGYGLFLQRGLLQLKVSRSDGSSVCVRLESPARLRQWCFVAAGFDAVSGEAYVIAQDERHNRLSRTQPGVAGTNLGGMCRQIESPFLVGAHFVSGVGDAMVVAGCFSGKIEQPAVWSRSLSEESVVQLSEDVLTAPNADLVGAWDFGSDPSSRLVRDVSRNGITGETVNLPTRAVAGRHWDGSTTCYRERPNQYGAIHFHDDDLDDAGWSTDFSLTIPDELASGMYAARLVTDGEEDFIPFFVRARLSSGNSPILFLIPTFTYLAYANDHLAASPEVAAAFAGNGFDYPTQKEDRFIMATGLSGLYDRHTDGSAVCYSSRLRPILTMRPTYRQPLINNGRGAPHGLGADLHVADWLEHFGYSFDVATDEDLHYEGLHRLAPYQVVITGTHPEYYSIQMLKGIEAYLQQGGRLMYIGGNGFYWVTSVDPTRRHTIEVRKWGATSLSSVPDAEVYHSSSGELGGAWRRRGMYPQSLVGVGFTAQGVDRGAPYRPMPDSASARVRFVFEGVPPDGLIGDHSALVNDYGAGGYEVDRYDPRLGSPDNALVLATTTGLSDGYQQVQEEILVSNSQQGGTVNPQVRADMVYFDTPNNGAVWSTGSIQWGSALSYNGYENSVSRVTRNVLDAFCANDKDAAREAGRPTADHEEGAIDPHVRAEH